MVHYSNNIKYVKDYMQQQIFKKKDERIEQRFFIVQEDLK